MLSCVFHICSLCICSIVYGRYAGMNRICAMICGGLLLYILVLLSPLCHSGSCYIRLFCWSLSALTSFVYMLCRRRCLAVVYDGGIRLYQVIAHFAAFPTSASGRHCLLPQKRGVCPFGRFVFIPAWTVCRLSVVDCFPATFVAC